MFVEDIVTSESKSLTIPVIETVDSKEPTVAVS